MKINTLLVIIFLVLSGNMYVQSPDKDEDNGSYAGCTLYADPSQTFQDRYLTNDGLGYVGQSLLIPDSAVEYGVDVSRWQKNVDWKKLIADKSPKQLNFCFIKATEDVNFHDKFYDANCAGARDCKLKVGSYHFYKQLADPAKQANNFANTIQIRDGDLLPVLDIEANKIDSVTKELWISREKLIADLTIYISIVKKKLKCKHVIIYTSIAFYDNYLAGHFDDEYFWLAKFAKKPPHDFYPSDKKKFICWQYTPYGTFNGFEDRKFDLNVMLKKFEKEIAF